MARHKDSDWNLPDRAQNWEQASVAVLMDIRDELRRVASLLSVLQCRNFLSIPAKLERIARQTKKRPYVRKVKTNDPAT